MEPAFLFSPCIPTLTSLDIPQFLLICALVDLCWSDPYIQPGSRLEEGSRNYPYDYNYPEQEPRFHLQKKKKKLACLFQVLQQHPSQDGQERTFGLLTEALTHDISQQQEHEDHQMDECKGTHLQLLSTLAGSLGGGTQSRIIRPQMVIRPINRALRPVRRQVMRAVRPFYRLFRK
uniref:(California timema) hypothetical protein n=1 Tax=Timema californicum TaxID=61474 RepID=A0A7R9JHE6_TIMCA|nr:unnamed protein product [Timema californicum]